MSRSSFGGVKRGPKLLVRPSQISTARAAPRMSSQLNGPPD